MKQPKPATKPKAQVREVFEIRPLRWRLRRDIWIYECLTLYSISLWKPSNSDGFLLRLPGYGTTRYEKLAQSKAAAEQWYRQQLGKALRRVK